jgi:ribosomal protein L11 methyltransferase
MTHTAALTLSEPEANRLAEAIAADDGLAAFSLDLNDLQPGRWTVTLYLPEAPDTGLRRALAAAARRALGPDAPDFAYAELAEEDWVAKSLAGLAPVRAGRFLVHGAHDRDKRKPNDVAIEIEAGQAFGTGHHGTTAGCLAAIDRLVRMRGFRRVLDLGTGSGVLAIALARTLHGTVLASDIDPIAVAVARGNARLNGVGGRVRAVTAAGLSRHVFAEAGPFDLIVANILAGPLVALSHAIRARLAPGGMVVLSGLLPEQRARIVAAYRTQGLRLVRSSVLDGWLTLTLRSGR